MTIRQIKKEAQMMVRENSSRPYFAAWYLYIGPALISVLIAGILTSFAEQQGYKIDVGFIVPLIIGYFSLWYARYAINIVRGRGEIIESRVNSNTYWEYFPYIALMSVLLLLNASVTSNIAGYIYIIIVVLELVFIPIPYTIVILNRENAGRIGLAIGGKYLWRTIALQIRFIPLYFLIAITFGIVGIFKYTYIQTTFAIYTLDLIGREKI